MPAAPSTPGGMRPASPIALVLASLVAACGPSTSASSSASASASANSSASSASPRPSSTVRPGLAELPADPPMKPPLMASGDVGGGPTIAGAPLEKATADDVKRALEKQRCTVTDGPVTEGIGYAVEATCDGHAFTVTFVAAGAPPPDAAKLDAAQRGAAVARSGAASLSIQPKSPADGKLAEELLARITSRS